MRTIERAHAIFSASPAEAARDAAGLAVIALLVFAGFLVPAIV